ncbi:MAG: hypothetical protein ACLRFF_02010 [Alphaproteobacteria bacterium]
MKRIILFFAVCLGLSVSQTTFAANEDVARAAKRTQSTTVSAKTTANRTVASDTKRTENAQTKNSRVAIKPSQQRVVNRNTNIQDLKLRTTSNQTARNVSTRPTQQTSATRTATNRATTNTVTNTRKATNAQTTASRSGVKNKNVSRAATRKLDLEKMANIKSADYSKCKTVYYECMDEFCANKDANLRRCACSSRVHEFDNIKKQLNKAEDKMLEFNQRLLTVNMDKEDAAAINIATEGETAFNIKDKSESEKILKKITKALDYSDDSKIGNETSSLYWDLNLDTAWDDVDAFGGIATSSKTGTDLYNAARPVCIEMAKEVCSDDELKIAQDGYKLTIQQDCNTVSKSYDTMQNKVVEKIHESSALLDMSRLNVYQERNSDDTLTCKKKILEQLSSTSVCGENLYKCLDMTGEYINPSNGKAFLSENLYNLANILQEPTGDEKWSTLSQNERFVNFLKSKKKFLEPAIEQCQDIADTIWKEFLDDALSQIKLAQKAKLEEIRRSCTTLVAECKTNALNDLSEFDSRALSVFSVIADKTANEMCRTIQNSCVAVMNLNDANTWSSGVTGITTDITYNTVVDTCAQIGRDCIIQKCNSTAGNFALCTNTTSANRISILKRESCWDEVLDCVKSADNLQNMGNTPIVNNRQNYYTSLYPNITYAIPDENNPDVVPVPPVFCDDLNGTDLTACLIAEQIWGNCETRNDDALITTIQSIAYTLNNTNNPNNEIRAILSNKILIPNTGSSLLSWFATNTNTSDNRASCNTYDCPTNYQRTNDGPCQLLYQGSNATTTDCGTPATQAQILNVNNNVTNFCETGIHDTFYNCCASGKKNNGICVPDQSYNALYLLTTECTAEDTYYCPNHNSLKPRQIYVYCVTTDTTITYDTADDTYICNGRWVLIDQYGNYFDVNGMQGAPTMSYTTCTDCETETPSCSTYSFEYANNHWSIGGSIGSDISSEVPEDNYNFMITYQTSP